jgi:uncharacterized MAPEG superfamily protein
VRQIEKIKIDRTVVILCVTIAIILIVIAVSYNQKKEFNTEVNMPHDIHLNEPFEVTVTANQANVNTFDVSQLVPVGWEIKSWTVKGNDSAVKFEESAMEYNSKLRSVFHWSFLRQHSGEVTIKYTINPSSTGENEIITIWVYPQNFDSVINNVLVV